MSQATAPVPESIDGVHRPDAPPATAPSPEAAGASIAGGSSEGGSASVPAVEGAAGAGGATSGDHSSQRYIIVGDVHGCVDELRMLLEACDWTPSDVIISVGDLVGKGPSSDDVVTFCRENGVITVRGNHDQKVLNYADSKPGHVEPFPSVEHEELAKTMKPENLEYLRETPLFYRIPTEPSALIVHAGLLPDVKPEDMLHFDILNMRCVLPDGTATSKPRAGTAWVDLWKGPEFVVFGHDATRGLQASEFAQGLDTGCCYGNKLTAFLWPERRLVQVSALREYSPANTNWMKTPVAVPLEEQPPDA